MRGMMLFIFIKGDEFLKIPHGSIKIINFFYKYYLMFLLQPYYQLGGVQVSGDIRK